MDHILFIYWMAVLMNFIADLPATLNAHGIK